MGTAVSTELCQRHPVVAVLFHTQGCRNGNSFRRVAAHNCQDFKNLLPVAVFVVRVRKISTVINDPNRRAFFP